MKPASCAWAPPLQYFYNYYTCVLIAHAYLYIVNLTSSEDVCPGDTIVFTCVTDTGQLRWKNDNDDTKLYYSTNQVNEPAVTYFGGIFALKLIHASATRYESTATAHNVSLNNDGLSITCVDDINNPDAQNNSETDSIMIGYIIEIINY